MAETEKVDNIDSITVSAKVMSKIIGVSDRRIRSLAQEKILVKASSGRYKLQESIKNYILNLRVVNDSKNPGYLEDELDFNEEKAKHERVKRHITELKYALMKGEMHRASDVEAVMINMLSNFRTKCLNLPSKITPILVKRDKTFIQEKLTDEVHELLHELADYNPSDFYGKEYIDAEDESEDDDEGDDLNDEES